MNRRQWAWQAAEWRRTRIVLFLMLCVDLGALIAMLAIRYREVIADAVVLTGVVVFTLFVGTVWAVPA